MNERDFLEFARRTPVFTTKQVAAALGDRSYSWVFLNRMVERGLIKRLKRGYYTAHEDPIIYASHIHHPSYISLWYAFQHYGTTTQLPARIEVMARRAEVVEKIELVRTSEMWGYAQVNYNGYRIFMADLEKAIIDAIETERVPVDEIVNAIGKADLKKLEEYALRMPVSAMKRIGYVAEMAGYPLEALFESVKDDRNYARYYAADKGNRWRVKK
jgi:predicted transcriptional regulator of viral defense system